MFLSLDGVGPGTVISTSSCLTCRRRWKTKARWTFWLSRPQIVSLAHCLETSMPKCRSTTCRCSLVPVVSFSDLADGDCWLVVCYKTPRAADSRSLGRPFSSHDL